MLVSKVTLVNCWMTHSLRCLSKKVVLVHRRHESVSGRRQFVQRRRSTGQHVWLQEKLGVSPHHSSWRISMHAHHFTAKIWKPWLVVLGHKNCKLTSLSVFFWYHPHLKPSLVAKITDVFPLWVGPASSPAAGFAYLFLQESSHLASAVFLSPSAAFLLRHQLLALQKIVLASGIILIIEQFVYPLSSFVVL